MQRSARLGRHPVEARSREIAVDTKEVCLTIKSDRNLRGALNF